MKIKLAMASVLATVGLAVAPCAHADTGTYNNMFTAVDWLARKYGVHVYTGYEPMKGGTYAVTRYDTIVFNSVYIDNPDLLRHDVAYDVQSGWHPGIRCTPEQYIAAHEFGHVLDNFSGHTADYELIDALSNGLTGTVSGYALTSYDEALAESVAAVECDEPTPAEQAIYTMLTT
jgi:hypothetical protein